MRRAFLLCFLSLPFCVQIQSAETRDVAGASGVAKASEVGVRGAVPNPTVGIGGNVAFLIDNSNSTVRFRVETIQNNATAGPTGQLYLRLFFSTTPFAGTSVPGFYIAEVPLGSLAVGGKISNLDQTVPVVLPPEGTYSNTFTIEEQRGSILALTDYFTFAGPIKVSQGQFTALGPPYFDTAPTSYNGRAQTPFNYEFDVQGSLDITVSASGLPAGLSLGRTQKTINALGSFYVSGIPTTSGAYPVVLTATNSAGTVTRNVAINISAATAVAPPNIICAVATPNPATPKLPVTFSAYAVDPENKACSYSWDFKDGTTGLGSTTSHTFAVAGTYPVVLTVNDGSQSSTQTLSVVVSGVDNTMPLIGTISASKNPAALNDVVAFSVNATDPGNLPLSYAWNFGDGTPSVSGQSVTHAFTKSGTFMVSLVATNSKGLFSSRNDYVMYVRSGTGDVGINAGTYAQTADGLRIEVMSSENGVVQFGLLMVGTSVLAQTRAPDDFFSSVNILGRTSIVVKFGDRPVNAFRNSGVGLIAANVRANDGSPAFKRPARKMVPLSSREVGEAQDVTDTLTKEQKVITPSKLQGTFNFTTDAVDTVALSCKLPLPEGFDATKPHTLAVGMGNVIDRVVNATAGKFTGTSERGIISALDIKYPKASAKSQFATINVSFNAPNLDAAGFESDGVNADALAAGKTAATVQLAIVLGGVPYLGTANVSMKADKRSGGAAIKLKK